MPEFLQYLASHITEKYSEKLKDISLVFPSRRAGLFFKNILSRNSKEVMWMSEVLSVVDFVSKYSGIKIENNIILNFELFEVYKKCFKDETFDRYYQWGNIILNDFDAIDKYLAEPEKIFKNIMDFKKIEERFPTELSDDYKNFWKNLQNEDTDEKKEFLKIWEKLGSVYKDFNCVLSAKKAGYEGLAYKYLLNNLKQKKIRINKHKIIFAGLNLITPSELGIISELIKRGQCEIHFDCDKYYYEDKLQEAGHHIRKSVKRINEIITGNELNPDEILFLNLSEELTAGKKNINFISSPTTTGMVKSMGSKLSDFIRTKNADEKTAVILPEESILMQVLYSVPEEIKEFNITMGYPFNCTLLYSFLILLKELHKTCRSRNGKTEFYLPDFKKLLLHPYLKFTDTGLTYKLINTLTKKNIIYLEPLNNAALKETFNKADKEIPDIFAKIFSYTPDTGKFRNYLNEIIKSVYDRIEDSKTEDDSYKKFQFEFIFSFYNTFALIYEYTGRQKIEIDISTFWKLLIDISSRIRVPFSGEPLKGMQIMGLLETRCIDFENIFILSMNEGAFPKSSSEISFIPYVVRKYFHLPTFEDEDSVYAYYFYRLIQEAKSIYLFYDTEPENTSKGKSRFLLQIEKELIRKNTSIKFSEKKLSPGVETYTIHPVTIEKSEQVMNLIRGIKGLSASAFISAITCKLKFYFDYILRLREPDEIEEEFGAATLGSIYHAIMQLLYQRYTGKIVTGKIINSLIDNIENKFDNIFDQALTDVSRKEKKTISLGQSPKNNLYKHIIKSLVKSTLECDFESSPFIIISLEEKFSKDIEFPDGEETGKISLNGYIDRVDSIDNVIRIIDYKTGSNHFRELKRGEISTFLDYIFSDIKCKDSFQIFFYAYSYAVNSNNKYKPVIYYVNARSEILKEVKKDPLTKDEFRDFESRIRGVLTDIFNPEIPFSQTENTESCKYCPYRDLCYRNT
ncbi:MAG: PD-(D/E)XK nuclease family protein [Ignavibacteria bacterium]|nr:PD-(D/E)XK nuclease family protein [Ignavibacteria bacterium]